MKSVYVPIEEIFKDPSRYSETWIQSLAHLASNPYFSRSQGGPKYLLDLQAPDNLDIRLTFWVEVPSGGWIPYGETSPDLLAIMSGSDDEHKQLQRLFRQGEEVFFEGYAKYSNGILWINVQDILIADPSIGIGPREIYGALHCPRAYYLTYVKNVSGSILKSPNRKITRGNLVHYIAQEVIRTGEFTDYYDIRKSERNERIRSRVQKETDTTFRIDAALHHLAETPLESVQKDTYFNLRDLFDDPELLEFFRGKSIGTECQINQLYGLTGVIDLLMDETIPVEMKTSGSMYQDQITQLKVYLLASYLESGNRTGYLLYTRQVSFDGIAEGRHIHEVTLSDGDIQEILYARHRALLLRKGLSLPSTLDRDCTGCRYAEQSAHHLRNIYPACQFYCQTERYWDCYECDADGGAMTRCALFDRCPVKFVYFDTALIDHCNKMRKAIMAESEELSLLSRQLRDLPIETLRICGQRVDNLVLDGFEGQSFVFRSGGPLPYLDMMPGDRVIVSTADSSFRYIGILTGGGTDRVSVRFDGTLHEGFFSAGNYALTKDYSEKQILRYLLKAIDYTQRNRRETLSYEESKKRMLGSRDVKPYDPNRIAHDLGKKKVIALQSPCQTSDAQRCVEVVSALPRPSTTLVILGNVMEIEEFIDRYPKIHDILVINREENFPAHPRVCEVGESNTPEEIADKIALSPVILTDISFLQNSHLLEFLCKPNRRVFFDYVLATGAEQFFEPFFFYLKNFSYHTLLIGDAYRPSNPVRSRMARSLGLAYGPFERLVLYESYFDSDDFSVYFEPFTSLPRAIVDTLKRGDMDIRAESLTGEITFIDVPGNDTSHDAVESHYHIRMGETPIQYLLEIESDQPLDTTAIGEVIAKLERDSVEAYRQNASFQVGEYYFHVLKKEPRGKTLESGENVLLVIRLPVQFSETLQELLFSNEQEVQTVLDVLHESPPDVLCETVVITPFMSQASRIKEELYWQGLADVTVLLPMQASGKSFRNVILSLVNANDEQILRYPLTDQKILYTMLTSARDSLTIIGRRDMIYQSRILSDIVSSPETRHL